MTEKTDEELIEELASIAWKWPEDLYAKSARPNALTVARIALRVRMAELRTAGEPSGEALAQAYRAGFKAGKVWVEPAPVEDKEPS